MRTALVRFWSPLWRSGAVALTTWLLLATSEPPCYERTRPLSFLVEGNCGPRGIVVVQVAVDEWTTRIANAAPLGLLDNSLVTLESYECPRKIEEGFRYTPTGGLPAGDAGVATNGDGVPKARDLNCTAMPSEGGLTWTCGGTSGGPTCSARLTVVR